MLSIHERCEGIYTGHAIASQYDPSISMAINISDSLLKYKQFNGPDILSRYLFLYHTQRCEVGETTKYLYQIALNKTENRNNKSVNSHEDFLFDQSMINESVKITNDKLNGYTAGCGPAQRSFPLALCPWISDDNLFDLSVDEAALTHYSPLAGQVAGIVNLICRSLLRDKSWHDAVRSAFFTPRLHSDICSIGSRYCRSARPIQETHAAYGPTALNGALYYISTSGNPTEAINAACAKDRHYCAPIVGILSGALWGIPSDTYKEKHNDGRSQTIQDIANKLCNQWTVEQDHVNA